MYWQKVDDFQRSAYAKSSLSNNTIFRFFETEGIAILTMLVSHYKITVKDEPEFANETFEQRKDRVLACRAGLTITYVLSNFQAEREPYLI